MNFSKNGRKSRQKRNSTVSAYPFAVQFYTNPPAENISLEEFEQLAMDRLAVLRVIENASVKYTKLSDEYKEYVRKQLSNLNNKDYKGFLWRTKTDDAEISEDELKMRRRDHISHFILRLAYCKSDELRKWFIKQEVDLFQLRFSEEGKATQALLKYNNLLYDPISESEKEDIMEDLKNVLRNQNDRSKVETWDYFKVPFQEVLELVGNRKVLVKGGLAYVPQNDIATIAANVFRVQLSQALAVMARLLPQMEEDDRLLSILKGMNDRYLGQDYGLTTKAGSGDVAPELIDKLSKTSFPICMRVIHESMRERHHLKHHGRLVYGLFLKAIGMGLEDALKFFRTEFLKGMDSETFEKKGYGYNIRYNYGQEGKKTNYTPYSCSAIITKHTPGPGDVHGCPYRHFDKSLLTQRLQAMNISRQGIQEIVDLSSKGHYQLACTKQFELSHGAEPSQPINHPNMYYEESRKILNDSSGTIVKADKKKPITLRSVILPSQTQDLEEMDTFSQEELETISQFASQEISFG